MPTAAQIARYAAIRNAKAKAANDDAPKAPRAKLELPNFVTPLFATEMKIGDTTAGKPYMALKGCEVELPGGRTAVRTAMVFDEAYDVVCALIRGHQDIVATVAQQRSTLKVIGLQVDGEMVMFEQKALDAAA